MDQAIRIVALYYKNIKTFDKYNMGLEDLIALIKDVEVELCK